jgi:hypothetical protein
VDLEVLELVALDRIKHAAVLAMRLGDDDQLVFDQALYHAAVIGDPAAVVPAQLRSEIFFPVGQLRATRSRGGLDAHQGTLAAPKAGCVARGLANAADETEGK